MRARFMRLAAVRQRPIDRRTAEDLVRARVATHLEPAAAAGAVEPQLVVRTARIVAQVNVVGPVGFGRIRGRPPQRQSQSCRLATGGVIDRSRPLAFEYDGRRYEGYAGDTLASALLANGVHLVGRSFKYHRPRGVYGIGAEEPNALVQLETGARTEPNARATMVELYEGLVARSQNCWPSVRFDVGAIANALSPLLPAGFYYKTFMWPPTPKWWLRYEHFIRGAAGMGQLDRLSYVLHRKPRTITSRQQLQSWNLIP